MKTEIKVSWQFHGKSSSIERYSYGCTDGNAPKTSFLEYSQISSFGAFLVSFSLADQKGEILADSLNLPEIEGLLKEKVEEFSSIVENEKEKVLQEILNQLPKFCEMCNIWAVARDSPYYRIEGLSRGKTIYTPSPERNRRGNEVIKTEVVYVISVEDAKKRKIDGELISGPISVYWSEKQKVFDFKEEVEVKKPSHLNYKFGQRFGPGKLELMKKENETFYYKFKGVFRVFITKHRWELITGEFSSEIIGETMKHGDIEISSGVFYPNGEYVIEVGKNNRDHRKLCILSEKFLEDERIRKNEILEKNEGLKNRARIIPGTELFGIEKEEEWGLLMKAYLWPEAYPDEFILIKYKGYRSRTTGYSFDDLVERFNRQ